MNMQQDNEISSVNNISHSTSGVGRILREAREQQGMSVNDVANRIKFAPRQIEWLEADDYIRLPEAAFVRGFVRSYARMLELDSAKLLAQLPSSHVQPTQAQEPRVKSVDIPLPTALSARRYNILLLVAALVIAVSLALFQRTHKDGQEATGPAGSTVVQPLELPSGKQDDVQPLQSGEQKTAEAATPGIAEKMPENIANNIEQPQAKTEVGQTPLPVVAAPVPAAVKPVPVEVKPAPVEVKPAPVAQPAPVTQPVPLAVKPVEPRREVQSPAPVPKKDAASKHNAQEQAAQLPSLQPLLMFQKPAQLADSPQHMHQQAAKRPGKNAAATASGAATGTENARPAAEGGAVDHALRLEFDEDAWAEIKDSTGRVITSRMHPAGSLVRVGGKGPLDVVIGNAKAVRLFDNGKKINLERYTTAEVAHIKLK